MYLDPLKLIFHLSEKSSLVLCCQNGYNKLIQDCKNCFDSRVKIKLIEIGNGREGRHLALFDCFITIVDQAEWYFFEEFWLDWIVNAILECINSKLFCLGLFPNIHLLSKTSEPFCEQFHGNEALCFPPQHPYPFPTIYVHPHHKTDHIPPLLPYFSPSFLQFISIFRHWSLGPISSYLPIFIAISLSFCGSSLHNISTRPLPSTVSFVNFG